MKDLSQFKNDLRAWMAAEGISQVALAKKSGVDQASISRFLRVESPDGLSGEFVLRLYPIVYPASHYSSLATPMFESAGAEE